MANETVKASVASSQPGFRDIADIGWLPKRNIRDDYGTDVEMKALDEALFPGWGQAFPCETTKLTAEDKAEVLSMRQARWEFLKNQAKTNADMSARLTVFTTLYVDAKGKLREPKVLGNTGNRRGSRWEEIQFKRLKDNLPILDQIPCYYVEHKDEAHRREAQLFENFGRENAAKTLNGREIVKACRLLFQVGYKESDLMRTGLKRGICQKLHRLYQLDALYPEVKAVDRILLPDTDENAVPWGPIDKEFLKILLDCQAPSEAAKKDRKPTDANVFNSYLVGLKGGEKPSKAMSKDDMVELGNQNPVKVVKAVIDAFKTNNKDGLFNITENAELLNLAMECHEKGKAKEAIGLLRKLLS